MTRDWSTENDEDIEGEEETPLLDETDQGDGTKKKGQSDPTGLKPHKEKKRKDK